jgi:hypothetical protein
MEKIVKTIKPIRNINSFDGHGNHIGDKYNYAYYDPNYDYSGDEPWEVDHEKELKEAQKLNARGVYNKLNKAMLLEASDNIHTYIIYIPVGGWVDIRDDKGDLYRVITEGYEILDYDVVYINFEEGLGQLAYKGPNTLTVFGSKTAFNIAIECILHIRNIKDPSLFKEVAK